MIPRRCGDDPTLAFLGRELRDQIDTASHFERASQLLVFVLDEDSRAYDFVESWVVDKRRPQQIASDCLLRVQDVRESRLSLNLGLGGWIFD